MTTPTFGDEEITENAFVRYCLNRFPEAMGLLIGGMLGSDFDQLLVGAVLGLLLGIAVDAWLWRNAQQRRADDLQY